MTSLRSWSPMWRRTCRFFTWEAECGVHVAQSCQYKSLPGCCASHGAGCPRPWSRRRPHRAWSCGSRGSPSPTRLLWDSSREKIIKDNWQVKDPWQEVLRGSLSSLLLGVRDTQRPTRSKFSWGSIDNISVFTKMWPLRFPFGGRNTWPPSQRPHLWRQLCAVELWVG